MSVGQALAIVVAVAVGAALGFGAGRRWGGSAGDRRTTPAERAGLDDYLGRVGEFGQAVPSVWAGQLESCRGQLDSAVGEVAARLGGIVQSIETALAARQFGTGTVADARNDDVFASTRTSLDDVVHTLDNALSHKRQILEQLQGLLSLNDDMKSMTAEVSRIAAQTHLLALNAAIEASRVGEAGAAFAVVAVEVRQLADLSGSTAKRIGMRAEEVGAAIALTFNAAEATALDEGTAVSDANTKVQSVLDDLMQVLIDLRESADRFVGTGEVIRDQIKDSIGQFGFEDQIGHTLHQVRDSILLLPSLLTYLPLQAGTGRPTDATDVLASLTATPAAEEN